MSTLEIENGNEKSVLGSSGTAWTANIVVCDGRWAWIISPADDDRVEIARCYEYLNRPHAAQCARLIAAAPDLYAIGAKILAKLDSEFGTVTQFDADELRAALLKAQGKS